MPEARAYNLRLPEDIDETHQLLTNRKLLVACIDARQNYDIWNAVRPDAFIAIAGGAAQPDARRRGALVDFVATAMALNPGLRVTFAGHDRRCGGVDHATSSLATKAFDHGGYKEEQELIGDYLQETLQDLTQKGIAPDRITMGIAHIGDGDQFEKIIYQN